MKTEIALERELFCAALFNGPLYPANAVAVLSGDGMVRPETAVGVLRQRAAHACVVLGGLDNPPYSIDTPELRDYMLRNGLAADRIITGSGANTYEQAEVLAEIIRDNEWTRVLLVTSPYHMPRAFLTVIKSLGADREKCQIIPCPANCGWWDTPDGLAVTRMDLLPGEFDKIERYTEHVATYAEGLAYLEHWE